MTKPKKVNIVSEERLDKYFGITRKALAIAEKHIVNGKRKEAVEILVMVKNYLSDAEYFRKQGHYVNAFAAINYAHGWLDTGSRLGIFNVKDDKLFVVK